jgi:1-phosphofructokinase family hexose kinase
MVTQQPGPFWCVSVNPAIDKRMRLPKFLPGQVNRVSEVRAEPGGKAAHVAMVLRTLGADPMWLGFTGGPAGEQVLHGLQDLGIRTHSVPVSGSTRTNLEMIDNEGVITEILEPGSPVSGAEVQAFMDACEKLWSENPGPGIVIASGSLPPAIAPDFYAKLTELAHRRNHQMFLDTSGEPLRLALAAGPDFVKPNREEAQCLLGKEITDRESQAAGVHHLLQLGARSAAISLGRDGLSWRNGKDQNGYFAAAPAVDARSNVGCGDATLAAFAYAASANRDAEKTLRLAVACGSANCLAAAPGRLLESDVRRLESQVHVERLP